MPVAWRWWNGRRNKGRAAGEGEGDRCRPAVDGAIAVAIAAACLPLCLGACRHLASPAVLGAVVRLVPRCAKEALSYMFPLAELSAAHDVVCSFVSDKALLHEMLTHLLFVTCHIQMGLGHIGIAFLCAEQRRKNMLIRMDVDGPAGREGGEERRDRTLQNGASRKEQRRPDQTQPHNGTASKSARDATGAGRNGAAAAAADPSLPFRRSAPAFILPSILPYMIQIILLPEPLRLHERAEPHPPGRADSGAVRPRRPPHGAGRGRGRGAGGLRRERRHGGGHR